MIRGAIFDMDGTLLDSMCVWDNLCQKYVDKFGVTLTLEDYTALESCTQLQNAQYFCNKYPQITESAEQVSAGMDLIIRQRYEEISKPRNGVMELLSALKQANIPMAVATLTDRKHAEYALKAHGIFNYFSCVLTIQDVGVSKREPVIYHTAAKQLGVLTQDCMVFEDAPYAATVAKQAGFQVCGLREPWYAKGEDELRAASDLFVEDSYSEILDAIFSNHV